EAELTRLLGTVNGGTYVDPSRTTVAEFLAQWDTDWASLNLSAKTVERYRELIAQKIKPHIGAEQLQKLKPVQLATLYAKLLREGRARGGALSARTVAGVHRVLHRALGHAQQWGMIAQNVAAVVETPSVEEKELEILKVEQAGAVLHALRNSVLF